MHKYGTRFVSLAPAVELVKMARFRHFPGHISIDGPLRAFLYLMSVPGTLLFIP